MRVLILSFYSTHVERGVEVWAEQLKKSLEGRIEIDIVGSTQDEYNEKEPVAKGTLSRRFFMDYWSRSIAVFTLRNIRLIASRQYDVVLPTNGGWQVLIVRLFTILFRKKMTVVGHSGQGWDDRWNLYCFPTVFVALTSSSARWARKINPAVKVVTIPNGVSLSQFSPNGKKMKLQLERPIYVYVGALEEGKRPAFAVEAVAKLKKGSLLVLGDGPLRNEIAELGTTLLGSRFKLTTVRHDLMPLYYRACDVFTFPTWSHESFGIVYLEAMASGLPIVTTDDDLKREIVGEAGLFIDASNIQEYSAGLLKAAERNWKGLPLKQVQKFSWETISGRYYDLFKSLI